MNLPNKDDLETKENSRSEYAAVYKEYMKASVIGLEVGLSVIVGIGGGYLFDRYFNLGPWGLIVGSLLGAAAAGRCLYAFTKVYLKEHKNDEHDCDIN